MISGLAGLVYALWCIAVLWLQPRSPLALVTFLAPCYLFASTWLWRHAGVLPGALAVVGLPALLVALYQRFGQRAEWFYVGEYAVIYLALASWFAASLRGTALITRVARRVHALTPDMVVYTRKLTRAWAIYFVGMSALSVLIFALLGLHAWAMFTMVLSPLSLVLFFVGEHRLRYHWHPEFERASLAQAVRGWRQRSR